MQLVHILGCMVVLPAIKVFASREPSRVLATEGLSNLTISQGFPAGEQVPKRYVYDVNYSNVSITFKPMPNKGALRQDSNTTIADNLWINARRMILDHGDNPWHAVNEFEAISPGPVRGEPFPIQLELYIEQYKDPKNPHLLENPLTWTTLMHAVVGIQKCFEAYPLKSAQNGLQIKIYVYQEEAGQQRRLFTADGVLLRARQGLPRYNRDSSTGPDVSET